MEPMDEFSFELLDDKYVQEIKDKSIGQNQSNADMRVTPSGCVINKEFRFFLKRILDFEVYPDDTWVLSFPKCGTTWTQEMAWLLINNLDYETAKSKPIRERFPFMELEAILSKVKDRNIYPPTIKLAENAARPRCIKSHLPVELLPRQLWTVKPKIVYVARNPRDAAVSYYHHHRLWNGYTGTFEDFIDVFLADRVVYAPYWNHVIDFWNIRDKPHVLFNTYEEMKENLAAVIKRTATFLEKEISDSDIQEMCEHLSFKNMKNNVSVNYEDVGKTVKEENNMDYKDLQFIRAGESGSWKKVLTNDMIDRFDEWDSKHLKATSFTKYPWTVKL